MLFTSIPKFLAGVMLKTLLYLFIFNAGLVVTFTSKISLHPHPSSSTGSFMKDENENFAVTCSYPDEVELSWYRPDKTKVTENRDNGVFVERKENELFLKFENLSGKHSGTYMCAANNSESVKFNLTVTAPITFQNMKKTYYAPLDGNVTIECKVHSIPRSLILWKFNNTELEGPDYEIQASRILIHKVTENKFGIYTCTAVRDGDGDFKSFHIELKLARAPEFLPVNDGSNVIHALLNKMVQIKCKVIADPSAEIQWYRNEKKLELRETNATIENKDNESILKIYFSNTLFLGSYNCTAKNEYGTNSTIFILKEGIEPKAPNVVPDQESDKSYKFKIYQTPPMQNLTNFVIEYQKSNDTTSNWQTQYFPFSVSNGDPYTLEGLEPNTDYIFKAGACTHYDVCAYTDTSHFKTTELSTNSANLPASTILAILATPFFIRFFSLRLL